MLLGGCYVVLSELIVSVGTAGAGREGDAARRIRPCQGGRVSTVRGHVTMLGDFRAVGKALEAVRRVREKGVGLGPERKWKGKRKVGDKGAGAAAKDSL